MFFPAEPVLCAGMLTEGARGQTQGELLAALGEKDTAQVNENCYRLFGSLTSQREGAELALANSIGLSEEVSDYRQNYLDVISGKYYGSVYKVKFGAEHANKAMTQWMSEKTKGLLSPKVCSDKTWNLVVINTLYLQADWKDGAFLETATRKEPFWLSGTAGVGESMDCDMMHRSLDGHIYVGDGFQRGSLPTKNGEIAFVLPKDGQSVDELLSDPALLEKALSSGEKEGVDVRWSLPKFSNSNALQLETLAKFGIQKIFSSEEADFTGITKQWLFVSNIEQHICFSVDEYGVKSSAATVIVGPTAAPPSMIVEMNLNRPFLYAAYSEDVLLFLGVYRGPEQ